MKRPTGSRRYVEDAKTGVWAITKPLQATLQRGNQPAAHRVCGPVEQDVDLQVVELSGMIAEIPIGLMMEILEVVIRVELFVVRIGNVLDVA